MEIIFTLAKRAAAGGGDKYVTKLETEDKPTFQYWPQSVSRDFVTGACHKRLRVTVEPSE